MSLPEDAEQSMPIPSDEGLLAARMSLRFSTSPLGLGGDVATWPLRPPRPRDSLARHLVYILETEATHTGAANPPFCGSISMCGFAVNMVRGD